MELVHSKWLKAKAVVLDSTGLMLLLLLFVIICPESVRMSMQKLAANFVERREIFC